MKETMLTALKSALADNDLVSIVYKDKTGKQTERTAVIDEVLEAKGIVRVLTENGFRCMTIANIVSI